jgi:hypothetical protein
MTEMHEDLPDNTVLLNGDKNQHSEVRGLDSKNGQNEQRQDHAMNRQPRKWSGYPAAPELTRGLKS